MSSLAARVAALLALLVASSGCARRLQGCEAGESRAECVFRRDVSGQAEPRSDPRDPYDNEGDEATSNAKATGWTEVDERLFSIAKIIATGAHADAVEAQVRSWCDDEPRSLRPADAPPDKDAKRTPGPRTGAGGASWICTLPELEQAGGRPVYIEYSQSAITISVPGLSREESERGLRGMLQRWDRLCKKPLVELEREYGAEELRTCELVDGPQIVIGRFPRDLEADIWQVSLMLAP